MEVNQAQISSNIPINEDYSHTVQRNVCNLPVELWSLTFKYIPFEDREPITRVCQVFRWLAQPMLYEYFRITMPVPKSPSVEHFVKRLAFAASPCIAPAVKACAILASSNPKLAVIFTDTLPHFRNLVALHLEGEIPVALILETTRYNFPNLIELGFSPCTYVGTRDQPIPQIATPPPPRVRYLEFGMTTRDSYLDNGIYSVSASLVHPSQTQSVLFYDEISGIRIVNALLKRGITTYHLRSLTIPLGTATFSEFNQFLDTCPFLEGLYLSLHDKLKFRVGPSIGSSCAALACTSLPRLKAFEGPCDMVKTFSEHRPVSHLSIYNITGEGMVVLTALLSTMLFIESLELYVNHGPVPPLSMELRAFSLVTRRIRTWEGVGAIFAGISFSPSLEYFSCKTRCRRPDLSVGLRTPVPLPPDKFLKLRHIVLSGRDGTLSYDPITHLHVNKIDLIEWQVRTLGLYHPQMTLHKCLGR